MKLRIRFWLANLTGWRWLYPRVEKPLPDHVGQP